MVRAMLYLVLLGVFSCSTGHNDKYGIYVPNTPNYSLKNKKGADVPKELDTLNLYEYYGRFDNNSNILIRDKSSDKWKIYDKYCSNGRVYGFGTDNLNEKNLDPNYGNKGYYLYDEINKEIKHEVFTNGNGGQFVVLRYKLSKNGDTLTSIEGEKKYHVYIKKIIPKEWKKYKSDW